MKPPQIKHLSRTKVAVYFPWRRQTIKLPSKEDFNNQRLNRNRGLITKEEQEKIASLKVGFTGLNVGNYGAVCFTLTGGSALMKLADPETLTLDNFNRFRASLLDIGTNKAELTAKQIWEINPFANLEIFKTGLNLKNVDKFLLSPKIDILVEEMDNLKLKIAVREKARRYKIPVIMVTGNAENVIIDIERFDKNNQLPLLNGLLEETVRKKIENAKPAMLTTKQKVLLARDFMGVRLLTKRLRNSFLQVGSQLKGIPQLAESSFLRGAVLCYLLKLFALKKHLPTGRFELRLDKIFN